MKSRVLISVSILALGIFLLGTATVAMAGHEIVGAPKCKMCHKAKTGDQWGKWLESKHAKAFEALATDAAKKAAADKGLGDPQTEAACLKCHTTQGFLGEGAVVAKTGKYEVSEGVGCEACHGAGSNYKKKKIMKDKEAAIAAGLNVPDGAAFCTKCHNEESPTFAGFDYEESWAKIAHPVPEK